MRCFRRIQPKRSRASGNDAPNTKYLTVILFTFHPALLLNSIQMKHVIAVGMLLLVVRLHAGEGTRSTLYVGGTLAIKEMSDGKCSTADARAFSFQYKQKGKPQSLSIPYERVNSLEYGQKAGRRVGMAIVLSPIALLSKKRKHFITIGFADDADKQQAAVFELGKGIVRTTLASLEARTGRKIEYQDEDAKKASKGN